MAMWISPAGLRFGTGYQEPEQKEEERPKTPKLSPEEQEVQRQEKIDLRNLKEIERLELKVLNEYPEREQDQARLRELRVLVENASRFIVTTLPGERRIFVRTPIQALLKKIAQWLGTFVSCLQIEYNGTVFNGDAALDLIIQINDGQRAHYFTVINREKVMEHEIRRWDVIQWTETCTASIDLHDEQGTLYHIQKLSQQYIKPTILFILRSEVEERRCIVWFESLLKDASEDLLGSILVAASYRGFRRLIKYVLEYDFPYDYQNEDKGESAMHAAARANDRQLITILLNAGASCRILNKKKRTVLHSSCYPLTNMAVTFGPDEQTIKLLVEGQADITAKESRGFTVLDIAMQQGRWNNAQRALIKNGASPNSEIRIQSLNGIGIDIYCPLRLACQHQNIEIIELLLKHHADVTKKDENGMHALHWIFNTPTDEKIRDYRAYKEDDSDSEDSIEFENYNSESNNNPLAFRKRLGNYEHDIIPILLKFKADVNAADNFGVTPLFRASDCFKWKKQIEPIRLLLNAHANPNSAVTHKKSGSDIGLQIGQTPLHIISGQRENRWTYYEDLNSKVIESFLKHGADLDTVTSFDETPLHVACREGDPSWIISFLRYGASSTKCDAHDNTPLHTLTRQVIFWMESPDYRRASTPSIIQQLTEKCLPLLFKNGADPFQKNKSCHSPLDMIKLNDGKMDAEQNINAARLKGAYENYCTALEEAGYRIEHEGEAEERIPKRGRSNGKKGMRGRPKVLTEKKETRGRPKVMIEKKETRGRPKVMIERKETRGRPKVMIERKETRGPPKIILERKERRMGRPKVMIERKETRGPPKIILERKERRMGRPKVMIEKKETRGRPKVMIEKKETRGRKKAIPDRKETRGRPKVMIEKKETRGRKKAVPELKETRGRSKSTPEQKEARGKPKVHPLQNKKYQLRSLKENESPVHAMKSLKNIHKSKTQLSQNRPQVTKMDLKGPHKMVIKQKGPQKKEIKEKGLKGFNKTTSGSSNQIIKGEREQPLSTKRGSNRNNSTMKNIQQQRKTPRKQNMNVSIKKGTKKNIQSSKTVMKKVIQPRKKKNIRKNSKP